MGDIDVTRDNIITLHYSSLQTEMFINWPSILQTQIDSLWAQATHGSISTLLVLLTLPSVKAVSNYQNILYSLHFILT